MVNASVEVNSCTCKVYLAEITHSENQMTKNSDNRKRAFADVVSIDAWHAPFGKTETVDLHADVVFGEARVGGEEESAVRFRLKVKRAEVVVVIPETEPVGVVKSSVSRDAPEFEARYHKTIARNRHTQAKAASQLNITPAQVSPCVDVGAAAGASSTTDETIEISATVPLIMATMSKTPEGHYRWALKSIKDDQPLEGRPWDGTKQPRLKLVDLRKDRKSGLPPTVRLEVRCKREDLLIEDLTIKNETVWQAARQALGFENRMAAAESYIRDRLTEEGLEVLNLPDIFGQLTLASVTAEPSS